MKQLVFLIAFIAFGATASFAADSMDKVNYKSGFKDVPEKNTCTVTVKTKKRDATITISCDCTQRSACDQAYALATIGMK